MTGPAPWRVTTSVPGHVSAAVAEGTEADMVELAGMLGALVDAAGLPVAVSAAPADGYAGIPVVHVWGQQFWHDAAHVAMSPAGALVLLAGVVAALRDGTAVASAFVNDGEGYDLHLLVADPDDVVEDATVTVFDPFNTPYQDPVAGGVDQVRSDHDVRLLVDAFDELSITERVAVPEKVRVLLERLRTRVNGPLLGPDDPRRES